jgi:hypothetical protein
MKIAILDDYQNVALKMANWSALSGRAESTVFNDHVAASLRSLAIAQYYNLFEVLRIRAVASR